MPRLCDGTNLQRHRGVQLLSTTCASLWEGGDVCVLQLCQTICSKFTQHPAMCWIHDRRELHLLPKEKVLQEFSRFREMVRSGRAISYHIPTKQVFTSSKMRIKSNGRQRGGTRCSAFVYTFNRRNQLKIVSLSRVLPTILDHSRTW